MFTKNFTYDPEQHSFKKEDDDILQELIRIYEHESMFKQSLDMYAPHGKTEARPNADDSSHFWPEVRERLSHSNHSCCLWTGSSRISWNSFKIRSPSIRV